MPMFSIRTPSIQLGILKATLNSNSIPAIDFYLNLDFAEAIGTEFFEKSANACSLLLGDWLFAGQAFPDLIENSYLKNAKDELAAIFSNNEDGITDSHQKRLIHIKENIVPKWIEKKSTNSVWNDFDVVGFSCTFSQTISSLALAKSPKERLPNLKIVFGGISMDGTMGEEVKHNSPYVDIVVQGEGEQSILQVVQDLKNNASTPIYKPRKFTKMDDIPLPDYTGYFKKIETIPANVESVELDVGAMPLETSRGCWWGQKNTCTFCGLNGENAKYREKSPEKVLDEIDKLSRKHQRFDFLAVDNILSSKSYFTFLPQLAEIKSSFRFFFETRANLSYERMKLLSNAGIHAVQPGIESLNTNVLRLMKKGTNAIQNLDTLKWGIHFGIGVRWNILYGFPGEKEEWYEEMQVLISKISHFQPPTGINHIRMDRFSPYFNDYFGISRQAPKKGRDI